MKISRSNLTLAVITWLMFTLIFYLVEMITTSSQFSINTPIDKVYYASTESRYSVGIIDHDTNTFDITLLPYRVDVTVHINAEQNELVCDWEDPGLGRMNNGECHIYITDTNVINYVGL